MAGRSIKLFLADGTPEGLIVADIGQWTGRALVASRQNIDQLFSRPEMAQPGVYILEGMTSEDDASDLAYIGEAEVLSDRVRQHVREKEFWTRVCILTSSDQHLTKSHVKYLESRLIELASIANPTALENNNSPKKSHLPESDLSDMEIYLEQIQLLLPIFDIRILESIQTPDLTQQGKPRMPAVISPETRPLQTPSSQQATYIYEHKRASAKAIEKHNRFIVLKGSTASLVENVMNPGNKHRRDELIQTGILKYCENIKRLIFTENASFSSPSAAASIVAAGSVNGTTHWKHADTGLTYAEWQDRRTAIAIEESKQGPSSATRMYNTTPHNIAMRSTGL